MASCRGGRVERRALFPRHGTSLGLWGAIAEPPDRRLDARATLDPRPRGRPFGEGASRCHRIAFSDRGAPVGPHQKSPWRKATPACPGPSKQTARDEKPALGKGSGIPGGPH
eukprot:6303893-Pyramimonas_sp.AAC.1